MHLWPLIAWPRRFRIQAFDSGRRPWEPDLSAIWREAAAGSDSPVHQTHRICSFCCRCAPDRRQGGAPPRRLPRLPGRITSAGIANNAPQASPPSQGDFVFKLLILAEGRGSPTCRRSGAKRQQDQTARYIRPTAYAVFAAAARQIADKVERQPGGSHAFQAEAPRQASPTMHLWPLRLAKAISYSSF